MLEKATNDISNYMEVKIMGYVLQAVNNSSLLQNRTHSGCRDMQLNSTDEVGWDLIVKFLEH